MYIIDLYEKLLPRIGNGPATMAETLKLIKTAYEQGVRVIFAEMGDDPKAAELALQDTKIKCSNLYPDFFICKGGMFHYDRNIALQDEDKCVKTLGFSNYVLTKFPDDTGYEEMLDAVRDIKVMGYKPILAGSESYSCLTNNISGIRELIAEGAYLQIDAYSLLDGQYADRSRNLIEHKLVHFVATGSQVDSSGESSMGEAAKIIRNLTDKDYTYRTLYYNGVNVMRDRDVDYIAYTNL